MDDIRNLLAEKEESYPQLSNKVWLINLSFLADFTAKLSDLNLELVGKDRNLSDMISSIRAFQQLSAMLKSNLKDRDYRHFPSVVKFLASNQDVITYNPNKFIEKIESVDREIQKRF